MKVKDFDFDLPENLIAKYPVEKRTDSRLLVLDGQNGDIQHQSFEGIVGQLNPGDLLVFNDTKVVPARLFGHKETGGKLEILFERSLSSHRFLAHVRASKSPKTGSRILLEENVILNMLGREGDLFILETPPEFGVFKLLEQFGHIPLPPYINRSDKQQDASRYQTVYARNPGAAAAPTAGLHFDQALLDQLADIGVNSTFITLHVGAGTFQPVKVEKVEDHQMHSEWIEVSQVVVDLVKRTRHRGGRVIAVGTTSLRSLESASVNGDIQVFTGETDIFIYPGYRFKTVDALLTNFHLPKSTLLMLVCAFSGQQNILTAYQAAIENKYRFFSYGDAMFLTPQNVSVVHAQKSRRTR